VLEYGKQCGDIRNTEETVFTLIWCRIQLSSFSAFVLVGDFQIGSVDICHGSTMNFLLLQMCVWIYCKQCGDICNTKESNCCHTMLMCIIHLSKFMALIYWEIFKLESVCICHDSTMNFLLSQMCVWIYWKQCGDISNTETNACHTILMCWIQVLKLSGFCFNGRLPNWSL